ncbi:hypothetical protein SAMN02910293_00454 [Streptococcus henryi]|uniref:Uncharacterized protein n=1 Tax=Streptococcus henryi TaxID=439219 RepID=A0A1G6ALQ6_9STRE|nr:hypothetical protein [Streptococcus henryi]QBX25351.1 hypothetical protein Javan252_0050 [Streptococcus phage Javan252]SDB09063.1 hypothetical protein SAMN02910293_00454 [Streptococcus henryi]
MVSLILSIISITLSVILFVVQQYKQLYRLGVGTGAVTYSNKTSTSGQDRQVMFVELSIINESQTPAIITGLTIVEKSLQSYSSDDGELIDKSIQVKNDVGNKHEIFDKFTDTLPIVIAPYSSFRGTFAFYQRWIYRQGYFIELETPKRFLTIPFNPTPDFQIYLENRHGRNRTIKYYWRQNPLRTFQNKILDIFYKKTWKNLFYMLKKMISKILSNLKRCYNKN